MSRRAMLALAFAITAFVLVSVGAVASHAVRTRAAAKVPDSVPADVVRAREAEYRRVIEEANARLRAQQAAVAAAPIAEPAAVNARVGQEDEGRAHGHHERRRAHDDEDDDG